MLKRLLLAVALPVLAAAPVAAQTSFVASGGAVTWQLDSFNANPFDFFLEAVNGNARRLLASENGTQISVDTKGQVANGGVNNTPLLDPISLGVMAANTPLILSLVAGGVTYSTTGYFRRINPTSFFIQYSAGTGQLASGEAGIGFIITGISSLQGAGCTIPNPLTPCSGATAVTATPEPATLALFATGLAGLIPVAIRRRRRSASPSSL